MDYIEFPKLGLSLPISREAFKLFGLSVYWYGIIISAAFFVAVLLGMKNSKKAGIKSDDIIDLVLFAAPLSIIGARLYYVIFNWSEFNGDILKIINIRTGGLALYGSLIGAVLVALIFCKVKKINALKLFDFCIPYFVLAQAIGRWGNFANQEAFGRNTELPWGMTSKTIMDQLSTLQGLGISVDPAIPVHPTFLYESLWNLGVFFLLIWFSNRKKFEGEVFCLYMIGYGTGRFWIEGLRLDSLWLGSFRVSQVLSLVFVIVFGLIFVIRRLKSKYELSADTGEKSEYSALLDELNDNSDKENVEKVSAVEESVNVSENLENKEEESN